MADCISTKKENKELLTYLLFEASNEEGFKEGVKEEISLEFSTINCNSYFYMKKSVRKILRITKKYIPKRNLNNLSNLYVLSISISISISISRG